MSDNWRESEYRDLFISKFYGQTGMSDAKVGDVADALGMSKNTLYKVIDGTIYLKPELIPALYNATGDLDFINWFIHRCRGLRLVKSPALNPASHTIDDSIHLAGAKHGDLCQKYLEAKADGTIDENERKTLLKAIEAEIITLGEMAEGLKSI